MTEVRVNGTRFRVIRRPMKRLFGKTYWTPKGKTGKILVDASLSGIPALSTLVHEMTHAMNWGLSEKRVQHLEYSIVNMILSNPRVFAALAAEAPKPPRRRRR